MSFQKGHKVNLGRRGRRHSKETKRKMAEAHKGKKHPEETKKKISEANKKKVAWNKGKKGFQVAWNKGKKLSKKHIKKILISRKGYKHSEETRKKISKGNKGQITWMKGKYHTKRVKQKMSENKKGKKNPMWKGGKSFEPYSIDWTQTLRRSIRERDHYTCQMCGELQSDRTFDIHHIDGDKMNCAPKNLITLCPKCHRKIHSV